MARTPSLSLPLPRRDIRCGDECSMRWHVHEDFVSGLSFDRARSCLLSVSGDSTLGKTAALKLGYHRSALQ